MQGVPVKIHIISKEVYLDSSKPKMVNLYILFTQSFSSCRAFNLDQRHFQGSVLGSLAIVGHGDNDNMKD